MGRLTSSRALVALAAVTALAALPACGRLPQIRTNLLPPVTPTAGETQELSGRTFRRVDAPGYELYVQSPTQLPAMEEQLAAATQEFARHFGPAPKVAVLLFDGPADPYREFDFAPFVERGIQVLAFVRDREGMKHGELGVDEGLLAARVAELLLAAYADSVARRIAPGPWTRGERAMDRLPHWFSEAVISRVARPDAVDPGVSFVRANRLKLMPLRRLFAMARLRMPTWSELAQRPGAVRTYTEPTATTPPPLLAAESVVFGEFLVSRYGPTFLQAMAEELLRGRSTEAAFAALPTDLGADDATFEEAWRDWLAARR